MERERLLAVLRIADERGLWVVSDEAYEDVIYAPHRHHSLLALAQRHVPGIVGRMVSLWSFSKSHAMSGLRVGYLVTMDPELRDRIPKVLRCSINGVNAPAQWAATAALEGPRDHLEGMRAEYARRRDVMLGALGGIEGVRPFVPGGGFYLWCELDPSLYARLGVHDADELSRRLAAQGVGSAPGDAFGESCKDAIRFAYSCATEMVERGAPVLRALLAGERPLDGAAAAAEPVSAAGATLPPSAGGRRPPGVVGDGGRVTAPGAVEAGALAAPAVAAERAVAELPTATARGTAGDRAATTGGGGDGGDGEGGDALRVALVQMTVTDGDPAANLARATRLVEEAPAADLYLLPELFTTGYAHDSWARAAREHTPGAIDALGALADRRGAWIAGSMIAEVAGGGLANRLHLVAPRDAAGAGVPALVTYDKAHLFPPMGEPERLVAGRSRVRVKVGRGAAAAEAALSICFDLRYPEMYRRTRWTGRRCSCAWRSGRTRGGDAAAPGAGAGGGEPGVGGALQPRGPAGDGTVFAGGSCVIGPDGRCRGCSGRRRTWSSSRTYGAGGGHGEGGVSRARPAGRGSGRLRCGAGGLPDRSSAPCSGRTSGSPARGTTVDAVAVVRAPSRSRAESFVRAFRGERSACRYASFPPTSSMSFHSIPPQRVGARRYSQLPHLVTPAGCIVWWRRRSRVRVGTTPGVSMHRTVSGTREVRTHLTR
jgi:hypothetical protein